MLRTRDTGDLPEEMYLDDGFKEGASNTMIA